METRKQYNASEERYSNGMEYRRCGKSGVKLPVISLGLWHNFGSSASLDNCLEIAHCAFDNGITCFDLANNYGPVYGSAEETFGTIMEKSFRPYRDELFITTKAGYDMWPGPYGEWGSRKYLMSSLDQSLKRMKVDYVDLFYSHRFDPDTPLEETLQALVDIVRQGKALYIGISNYPVEVLDFTFRYLKERDVPCLIYQGRYSMMSQDPRKNGIIDSCYSNGVGFTAFSPLAQGLLTNRYLNGIPSDSRMAKNFFLKKDVLTEEMVNRISRLNDIAGKRGQELSQMALAWLIRQADVTSVIVGASSATQLKTNLAAIRNTEFTESDLAMIADALK